MTLLTLRNTGKSQYSMEFLIFFSLISIVFVVWLVIYADLSQESFLQRDKKAITDLGNAIQTQIFLASNARPGFHSDNLIIPETAGRVNFIINNTPYVFYIRSGTTDYVFHIPYTNGTLEKGLNKLWTVAGIVVISDFPPAMCDDGNLCWTNCSDGIDNDGDNLTDDEDGGCWYNATNPCYCDPPCYCYRGSIEEPSGNVPPEDPGYVYNYYVICKNAQEQNFCDELDTFGPITSNDCCQYSGFCCEG